MAEEELNVLLVEDNPGDARLLEEDLRDADATDVRIHHVVQLRQGLELLAHNRFDLVMLDLSLPDASGIETFTRLRDAFPDLPVVVLTGLEDDSVALEAVREGAQDFLVKGRVEAERLVQAMRYAVERQRIVQKARTDHQLMEQNDGVTRTQRVSELADGQRDIAGYAIKRILGEGSMATVYLAQRPDGGKVQDIALKVMKFDSLSVQNRQALLDRFFREAEVAASVRHPNVVEIFEFGTAEENQAPYIAMEYVSGVTLQSSYRDPNRFNYRQKARIIRDVALALSAIHELDICHRDVKPGNIMIDEQSRVKITDFGIALVPGSDLTLDLNLLGSPAYMSPEGFNSPKVGPLADIFSLGVVGYELFTGERPFEGETIAQLAHQVQHVKPLEPRKRRPDLPEHLQAILARMLKKHPSQRYPTGQAVAADLDAFIEGGPPPSDLFSSLRRRFLGSDWS